MVDLSPLAGALDASLKAAVPELGFRDARSGRYLRRLSDACAGWLGTSIGRFPHQGLIVMTPNVGVREHQLEAVLAIALEDPKSIDRYTPTISTNLGRIATPPTSVTYPIVAENDVPACVDDMVTRVRRDGEEFFSRYDAPEPIEARLVELDLSGASIYRRPVARYIRGDLKDARDVGSEILDRLATSAVPVIVSGYRRFLLRLEAFMTQHPTAPSADDMYRRRSAMRAALDAIPST